MSASSIARGRQPGVQHEPVPGRLVQLLGGCWVGPGVGQGEPVPELPELGLFGLGHDAVGHGVGHALFPAFLKG